MLGAVTLYLKSQFAWPDVLRWKGSVSKIQMSIARNA